MTTMTATCIDYNCNDFTQQYYSKLQKQKCATIFLGGMNNKKLSLYDSNLCRELFAFGIGLDSLPSKFEKHCSNHQNRCINCSHEIYYTPFETLNNLFLSMDELCRHCSRKGYDWCRKLDCRYPISKDEDVFNTQYCQHCQHICIYCEEPRDWTRQELDTIGEYYTQRWCRDCITSHI